jgi:hypothetical protein
MNQKEKETQEAHMKDGHSIGLEQKKCPLYYYTNDNVAYNNNNNNNNKLVENAATNYIKPGLTAYTDRKLRPGTEVGPLVQGDM